MKRNVGKTDKVLRYIVAIALIVISMTTTIGPGFKTLLLVFAVVALLTAFFGF